MELSWNIFWKLLVLRPCNRYGCRPKIAFMLSINNCRNGWNSSTSMLWHLPCSCCSRGRMLTLLCCFFKGIRRGSVWEMASVKLGSHYLCYFVLGRRDYTIRGSSIAVPTSLLSGSIMGKEFWRGAIKTLWRLQNLWCKCFLFQSTELIHKKLERQLDQCQAAREDHRITESQNSRGWKGPLWVI